MAKTPGLLGRKKSNFEPTEPYVPEQGQATVETNEVAAIPSQPKTEEKQVSRKEKESRKLNRKRNLKISKAVLKFLINQKKNLKY